ncbi:MAG: helix-turn-helix domain-containing protein [Gammaproteobacteria bacterium]|nr:helix-turn-helix domain-containing protein [Gammaproteobacteria bacterium]
MNRFTFAFENRSFSEVVAACRDHLARVAMLDVVPLAQGRLASVGLDLRALPSVTVGRLWCSPARASRTAAHVVDGNDNIVLVMPVDTEMVISRSGQPDLRCRPGQAYVWPCEEPTDFSFSEQCTTVNVSLPRAALAASHPRLLGRMTEVLDMVDAREVWLLRDYATVLIDGAELSAEAEHLAVSHLVDLAGLLEPSRSLVDVERSPGVHAARLRAIQNDALANLARPPSAEEMASRHGISSRQLRVLFAEVGSSYTTFILTQRLARAERMLTDPRLAGKSVASIAYACGFNDLSWFNRTFRRHYGRTPSEVRPPQAQA